MGGGQNVKSDYELIVRQLPGAGAYKIYAIADLHAGALEHNRQEWERFTRRILAEPNSYLILGGDLINNSTRSSVGNIFEETMRPRDQKRYIVECLAPLRDRVLCATSGNHERRSVKDADDDPTYDIMAKLDLEDLYRPNIAFLKLQLYKKPCGHFNNTYTFAVTHGAGGGIYTGAAVNRNERFGNVIEGIDCLIVGHTHKGAITKPQKIVVDTHTNTVSLKPYTVVSMTSWMAYGGYAAQKMLLPSDYARADQPQQILLAGSHRDKRLTVVW